jgi:hypothetical protein
MKPTPHALRQARYLARVADSLGGPVWEEVTPGRIPFAPPVDAHQHVDVLAAELDSLVSNATRMYRRWWWALVVVLLAIAAALFGTAAFFLLTGRPSPSLLFAMLGIAPLVTLLVERANTAGIPLMAYGGRTRSYTRALVVRLSEDDPHHRLLVLQDWRTTAPFAVAWLEGTWSISSLVHRKLDISASGPKRRSEGPDST